jgi:hypothetical protein
LFKLRFNNSITFVTRLLVLLASIILISGLIMGSGCQCDNAAPIMGVDNVSTGANGNSETVTAEDRISGSQQYRNCLRIGVGG